MEDGLSLAGERLEQSGLPDPTPTPDEAESRSRLLPPVPECGELVDAIYEHRVGAYYRHRVSPTVSVGYVK
jgi:hypothetical protein